MKHFLLLAVSAVMLAVVGWNLYQRAETKIARDSRVQANIDAITSVEKDDVFVGTTPPDPWNYTPNAKLYIAPKQIRKTCMVNGVLDIDGIYLRGEFQSGISYRVLVEISQCKGNALKAWCDQRKEGAKLISYTQL